MGLEPRLTCLPRSRRFKVGNSEYKWKIADNQTDLFVSFLMIRGKIVADCIFCQCVDSRNRTIASWSQETLTLRVTPRAANILDRLIVTCTLNLYMKQLGHW